MIAYAGVARDLPVKHWVALTEAHAAWVAPQLASWEAADALIERTEAPLLWLAAAAVDGQSPLAEAFVNSAARAWGYLIRAAAMRWMTLLPGPAGQALARARKAYADARHAHLAGSLFPAFGHLALTPAYLRSLQRGQTSVALLARQWRLVIASATGRL